MNINIQDGMTCQRRGPGQEGLVLPWAGSDDLKAYETGCGGSID